MNKLDAAFNNNTTEDVDSVSEEDEAAELKEAEQKPKEKVCRNHTVIQRPTTKQQLA